jgi:hypothetical protein
MKMPKILYDYVMFYANDPYELPIKYLKVKKISELTGLSINAIHKRFKASENNIITIDGFSYERFRKASE